MPSTYNDVGQNARRAQEASNFGTRKLAFYSFTCNQSYNMVGATVPAGYSFRVNTNTGVVSFDATITERSIADMNQEYSGNWDYAALHVGLPFNISFLGAELSEVWVNADGGLMLDGNGNSEKYIPDFPNGNTGGAQVVIANNDAQVSYVYSETTGNSGSRQFRIKVGGNTDYAITSINMIWEVVFYEDDLNHIDFLVTHQPINWSEYRGGQNNVYWGVTDGTQWVDGLSNHRQSFAPMRATSNPEYWAQSNSLYYRIVQALQYAGVELFWLGKPHRTDENFVNSWDGLAPTSAEGFVFAIADDANSPRTYTEFTNNYTAIETDVNGWVNLNTYHGINRGQRIVFSGDTFGGIVAGKTYYAKDVDGEWIQISDTVDPINNDGTADYPPGYGFPGEATVLEPDTGSMGAKQYWDDINWQGTAGDVQWACCNDPEFKWITAWNLERFVGNQVPELTVPNADWWNITRCQSTFGIFPSGSL